MDSAFPITPELESQALKVLQSDYTYLAALLAPLDLPDGYSQPSRSRTMFTFLRRFHAGPLSVRLCQVLRNSPFVYTRTHAATLLRTLLPAFPPIVKTTLLECLREESYPQVLKPLSHVLFDIMDRAPWPELMNFLLKSVWEDGKQRIQVNCLVVFAHWRNFEILKPHWEGLQEAILRKLGFGEDSDVQDAAFRAALNFLQPSSNLSTRDQNEEHLCRMLKALCQLLLHFNEEGVARMRKMAEMLTSDGKWSDLFILLSMCVTSELKILQESALLIFSKLHNWSPPTKPLIPHREDLRLAFLHALDSSELSTRLTAFCAVVSLTLMKVFEKVSDFLEKMLSLLFELVDNKEEASVQKALSELHGWAVAMPGIMKLRLELVFRCLVQFADCDELEDRTRFLSVQILVDMAKNAPGMMRGLRPTVMKTLFSAIIRMLSDIEEPRILTREMGFLNQLSVALCGSTVMPIATELLLEYLSNEEWQKRRAGLIAFAVIVDGSPMVMPMYLDQILGIVLKLFKDSNPGVRQAASYVIEKLSVELSPQLQIQYHHQVMPALAPAIEDFENPKEQMNAILALFFFSKGCTSDIIAPYLDEIVNGLLEILQKENQTQKLQGAALAALSFVATSSQNYFQKYYNNVMPRLRTILQAAFDTDKRTVCAKSVECICSVAAAVGKHTVGTDAEQVLAQLLPMQVSLKERDNPIRSYLMQGWVKLYKCLGTEFVPHMNDLMPHFLQYANEFIDEKFTESIKNAILKAKAAACNMLSCCAIEMKENFYQWISQVVETLVPLLKFSGNDKVRMAAISAMPDLLHSAVLAKDKGPYDGSDSSSIQKFVDDAIPSLVQVLDKEPEQENSARTISILKRCIEIPGMHVKSFQVKLIVDEVKKILESISKRNSEIVNRVKSDDFNIEDDKFLKRQKEQNVEIVNQIGGCLESLIGKLKIDFLPFFDELLPYMIVMLANDKPTKEKQTSFHIFNSVMQHCQEVSIKYYNTYLPFLLKACEGENPIVLQEAALGIGICAEFGGSDFKPYIGVVLSCLNAMLECPYELGSDGAKAYDKAVSALGKICEFHSRSINAEQVLSTWLSHLPIRNDLIEAKLVHEKLCEMVEKQDTELRCPKNLPKVISVFAEVISQHEKLASEETCEKMMNFLRKIKLDPPSDLEEVISSLHPQQQDLLKTIF